jgi:pyridoxal 5'-phosphate synthase pdxS subunit
MATSTNGAAGAQRWKEMSKPEVGDWRVKGGLAQMLKGGVIMDVVTPDQAKVAEDAGAVSVMALERVPSDIRRDGGVARMSDPDLISGIIDAVSIPVMAKARIGHFVEAQILESLGVDYCDESEVLTPADNEYHIDKWQYKMPYVCGAGAAMIRTKGEAGTGDIVHAVTHARQIQADIRTIQAAPTEELMTLARDYGAPYELVVEVARTGKLPVVNFAAGGIATPADAALLMQIGVEGVFVGSGIFKSDNPAKMADAIVRATTHFNDPDMLAEISRGLGDAMPGIEANKIPEDQQLQTRGW